MFFNSTFMTTLTELVTMEGKSYCCNTCHKPLKCYSSLRTHEKLHSKYGEFVCHICGADFIWKGSFISHASFHVRAGDALNTENFFEDNSSVVTILPSLEENTEQLLQKLQSIV
ncbi:Sal-like protein 4 [Trichinella patagoniensis]|uniref:Sal-like protein 4 n=1 Tax=Trichinella patagoniensis TaxID=990121 RepID=A0A0V1ACX7_9BILA|nr:Sal-like protein 4 [Trichinella patagoniensis]